ncbi:MAG: flagellar basal-body MS-ring/collar protein FliF [Sphingomonas sp.]|uniref:flagellar basal-body MS-ring/collar protein FliF n=1 Tax=Sphingomonas sp. TaxID=28214 RepID=UPI002272EF0B|nr:flagellar basal-body MS-ring/collar protein FliF [Sphingomonas sp.]MCX8475459.1 flagellar basal-body MS-ring/collar protein FliF [Sphingomonas sp.]
MSEAAPAETGSGINRQLLVFGGLFAAVVAVLGLGYFLFLRPDYVVLAQDLRPADASVIVAELEKGGADYKLKDGGTTILVPSDRADATRLAISGSDAAARGQIGFELFNKSDMGLTNFAQKINYQRALQGELVRTIMQMEGVESARVHLGLPERALFRGDRTEPSAAVTLALRPGLTADPARVAGIQRLVAAAVPDLPEAKVVVLDAQGRVISAAPPASQSVDAATDEQQAIRAYFAARARAVVEQRMPGQKFALRVLLLPIGDSAQAAAPPADWVPGGEGESRNFRLRILLVTAVALGAEDQAIAREAIARAVALDPVRGDDLGFEVGPVELAGTSPPPPAIATPLPVQSEASSPVVPARAPEGGYGWLALAAGLALAMLGLALLLRRRGAAVLGASEHEAFAAKLRRQLNLTEDASDAAR